MQGDGGDWHMESDKIVSVYSNCVFTVAAVDSTRLSTACKEKPLLFKEDRIVRSEANEASLGHFYMRLLDTGNFPSRPNGEIDDRAWVLQEKLLSKRFISITKDGIFWDCLYNYACDRRPTGFLGDFYPDFRGADERAFKGILHRSHLDDRVSKELVYNLWRRIIQEYTARKLSNPTDRMVALNGITKKMNPQLEDELGVGIWKRDTLRSLIWFVERSAAHTVKVPFFQASRPGHIENTALPPWKRPFRPIQAPSWSWISLGGEIQYRL